jgi:hypothetical protein
LILNLRRYLWPAVVILGAACTLNQPGEIAALSVATIEITAERVAVAPTQQPITAAPTRIDASATHTPLPAPTHTPVEAQQTAAHLRDFGRAPEFHAGIWLNTNTPLPLADLRGKVVLLEMWTFG